MSNEEGGVQSPAVDPAVEPAEPITQPTIEPTTEPAAKPPTEPEPYTPSVEPELAPEPSKFDALSEDAKQSAYDAHLASVGAAASPQGEKDWDDDLIDKFVGRILPMMQKLVEPMQQDQGTRALNEGLNEHEVAAMAGVIKENNVTGEMLAGIAASPATRALFRNAARFKASQTFSKTKMNGEPEAVSQVDPADTSGDAAIVSQLKALGRPYGAEDVKRIREANADLANTEKIMGRLL